MKPAEADRRTESQAGEQPASSFKSYYVLTLLTLVWSLSFLDRNIISVVLEPIKKEFVVSDTLLGLMVGFGFVIIYSVFAMPLARMADRRSRIGIIAIGVAFWSAMTSLGGFSRTIIQLLLSRIGIGVGESSASAPAQSLVADYFPKDKRPLATSILSISPYVGMYGGFLIGGIATTYWGWRSAFFIAGLCGLVVAAIIALTVKEPRRGIVDGKKVDTRTYGLGQTIAILAKNRTFVFLVCGWCFTGFTDLAFSTWFPSFLIRVHHMTIMQVGAVGGTIKSISGVTGVIIGGLIVARLGKKNDRWKIIAPGLSSLLAGPAIACFLFLPMPWAWVGLVIGIFLMGFRMGPILGLVQTVVKVRMRAFAAATVFLLSNLFAYGVGPFAIGGLNDLMKHTYGPLAVRYSLICVTVTAVIGAIFFLCATPYVTGDIERSLEEE